MPEHTNPFLREGLVRRIAPFALALAAGFVMVPIITDGKHSMKEFLIAAGLTGLITVMILFVPWKKVPTWIQTVPPLLYMVVVAELYSSGGGASSGFGTMILLPILWLALYGTQAQMIASIVCSGVVVLGPLLILGGSTNPDPEYRRGVLILIVGAVIGFTVQRLVMRVKTKASEESDRANSLQEATHQFDRAFETAPIGMAITTVAGRFMRVNPALCSMVGRTRDDLIGKKMEEITEADDRADDIDAIPKLISGEISTYQAEKRYRHVDGHTIFALLSITLVRDSAGAPRHFFTQIQDVTGTRQAEQRLREAEERYRTMVEQLPLVTYVDSLDQYSSAVYMSPQVEPLLGYSVDEWLAEEDLFPRLLHPDDRERVMDKVVECNETGAVFEEEYRLIAQDGRVVWIRDEAHHIRGEDGSLRQMQGLMMDITDQKAAERRLLLQHSVATTIASATSLDDTAVELVKRICESMEWDVGVIWKADNKLDELRCVGLYGGSLQLGDFERATREWTFRRGEGLPGTAWAKGEPHSIDDFGNLDEFPRGEVASKIGLRSGVAFPIQAGGKQLGVIELFSKARRNPNDDHFVSLMASVTAQLGQFMERVQAEDRLREAEERYRQLVERLPAITYIASFGEAGKWLYVSPQIQSTLGYTPTEWMADSSLWYERLHPDDREQALAEERATREDGEVLDSEYRMIARDGGTHWFRDEAIVVERGDGAGYLSGMMTDITEEKLIEQAIQESEKRFRAVGTQAPVGIFETDANGNCIFVNDRWCELSGMTPEEASGLNWGKAIHPEDRELVFDRILSNLPSDEQFEAECRVLSQETGRLSWVTANAVSLRDGAGAISGYLGTIVDITERKRSERYHSIQYAISKAMADSTGYEDSINRMVASMGESMGWGLGVFWASDIEEVTTGSIGRPVATLRCAATWMAPGVAGGAFADRCNQMTFSSPLGMLGRVWEGGKGEWASNLGGARSERARMAVDLGMNGATCLPVFGDNELLGVIEFFGEDVEDPGPMFLDVHAGIGRQIGEYLERKRTEAEAERAKDEFFALVSHELRTPLTSIIGYLELMQEDDAVEPAEQQHFLGIVHRNADRLLRLVGDLLLVAQVQAGKFQLRPGSVDLTAIAEHAVEAASPMAKGRSIDLVLKAEPVPEFHGDRDRVAQLFDNLISNALKFTDPGERVEVRVSKSGSRAVVEVNNSGSTIPEDERRHLFDRFFRASDATTKVAPGVGLGLAIVKAIVEAHGGSIRVESDDLTGTTFRFTLPLNEPVVLEDVSQRAA